MLDAVNAFIAEYGALLAEGTWSTIVMVLVPTAISYAIGLVLGVVLYLTAPGSLRRRRAQRRARVDRQHSAVVPVHRAHGLYHPLYAPHHGDGLGHSGDHPAARALASPFIARMVEQSLAEVPRESVEAVEACGASVPRIVFSALLPEALPSIVRGVAVVLISVLGYTAMAGAIGAGGLGDIAVRYGYYRRVEEVMWVAVIILIVIVQVIQSVCDLAARKVDHRSASVVKAASKRAANRERAAIKR